MAKHKGSKDKKTYEGDWRGMIRWITFIALLVYLFYPPYLRGLFFPETQHGALIFAAILFWFTWISNKEDGIIPYFGYKMDYLILAYLGIYILGALISPANVRLALNEVVKITLYFMVYWMVSRSIRTEKDTRLIINTLYFSGIGVAFAGLMTATGIIDILDGYKYGRIASTLQYSNALGGYLITIFFFGFYLWLKSSNNTKFLYNFGNYTVLTVFFASQSRGALLVFAPLLLIMLIGINRGQRLMAVLNVSCLIVVSILVNIKLLDFVEQGAYGISWLWFLFGGALAIGSQLILKSRFINNVNKTKGFLILAIGMILLVGSIVFMEEISNSFKFVKEIKLTSRNSLERQHFYADAWKMIKDKPVFGFGGGGWQAAYKAYQSYFYSSRQVHNHYLQTWVEVGTVGIATLISIWGMFFYRLFKFWHEKRSDWDLIWLTSLAALGLGIHAIIDFDLSLSALSFLIFAVFGIHTSLEPIPKNLSLKSKQRGSKSSSGLAYWGYVVSSIISLVLLGTGISYLYANDYARSGGNTNSPYVAQEFLEKAVKLDPFNSNYYIKLAETVNTTNIASQAITLAEEAQQKDSYNSRISSTLAGYYLQTGNFESALESLETAKEVDRFNYINYDAIARVNFIAAQALIEQGKNDLAKAKLISVLKTEENIQETLLEIDETEQWLWDTGGFPKLEVTPFIKLNIGSSYYLLGDFKKALSYLKGASKDQNLLGEVYLWQSLTYLKLGEKGKAEELKNKAIKLIPPIKEDYKRLSQLPLIK